MIDTVPLFSYDSDSVQHVCPVCNGKGTVLVNVFRECPICSGLGTLDGEICPGCHGLTPVYEIEDEQVCPACNGQVYI